MPPITIWHDAGSLRARLATAEARITSISGRSHAVKVFSPSKYPAPEKLEDYVAVNHGGSSLGKVRGHFLVFVQLFEKYGTLIERYTALIEKVSAFIRAAN
eukprot:SAG31_NODE_743_length_12418_cov_3.780908_4_plen_101_part_00